MPTLDVQLRARVTVDFGDLFTQLAGEIVGVDFGDVRFDASGILGLVARAAPVDLAAVVTAVEATGGRLGERVGIGLPGAELPALLGTLTDRIGALRFLPPDVGASTDIGIDGLAARFDAVRAALDGSPMAELLALLPGIDVPGSLGRVGGSLGGLLELARLLAGLTATAAVSARLETRAEGLARMLDLEAAVAAGARLGALTADTELVAALRRADPNDRAHVERLGGRVVTFLDAVLDVGDRWSAGMAFGEAALVGVDLGASAAALEVARLAIERADLERIGALVADVRAALQPLLDVPLPSLDGEGGFLGQVFGLVVELTAAVRAWNAASVTQPVQRLAGLALRPVEELRASLEAVGAGTAGAIRALRQVVDEVDLTPVANALRSALQPVTDMLDAIEDAVGAAQSVLEEVADAITAGLGDVRDAVATAAGTVQGSLGAVHETLSAIDLAGLADRLRTEIAPISAALASADLSPYFDGAIDVIDTAASVVDAVPFSILPTDVQQEIVDVCRPIEELDLQPVEDALRAELAGIRASLRADALDAVAAVHADVVQFLASLDPGPLLAELEATALAELRSILDGIDPVALLAPATAALESVRGLLDGIDLRSVIIEPLHELFRPVLDAIDALDPAANLAEVRAEVDRAREAAAGILRLDTITARLAAFRERATEFLGRVDPAALASALDGAVAAELRRLPAGPPGGAFGSLLVSLAQASGMVADETAVADVIAWVGGREDGAAVVKGRLQSTAQHLAGTRAAVGTLDPAPLAAAAQAHHRALAAAVAVHPAGSPMRAALDPLLAGVQPSAVLGGLAENRRRYLLALDADVALATTLAASGRSEVRAGATGLRARLIPLDAFPARLRALLGALGIADPSAPMRDVVVQLLDAAGPARLVPFLTELGTAVRDQVLAALDAVLAPVLEAVDTVRGALDAVDLGPVVDELVALHQQVRDEIAQLSPEALLGDAVAQADGVIGRLRGFDPLQPVEAAIEAAKETATQVLETARPTVVFRPVVDIHAQLLRLAAGLDVAGLLAPVLASLDGIVVQLDGGFDRTGDALVRLQDALPSAVTPADIGASLDVDIGIG